MTTAASTLYAGSPYETLPPELVWKRLARLVTAAGRTRMRLWNPDTNKFSDTAKLTERLPKRPAATYLYAKGRTQLLWLDFDSKRGGIAAVEADVATAVSWITQCGGVAVVDRSTSGGAHLMCPLAIGTAATVQEMIQLVRILASRLRTLDITPNTNVETGCMTPPGSPCKEGGYRQLLGGLDTAVEAFTTRSSPDMLPRLYMLLGALNPSSNAVTTALVPADLTHFTEGHGDEQRIAEPYLRNDDIPPVVLDFATTGAISDTRPTWHSNHEPRQSVVAHAVARGYSHSTLRQMIEPGGPWHEGLGQAYRRYGDRADLALGRDVHKALTWLTTNVLKSSPPRHKSKYTPGGWVKGARGPRDLRAWLADALVWADSEFAGRRYRWTVHAVLQTLAFQAYVGGERRSGTWLVSAGGRSLSLASGLLSEDTIWRVLADLREREGAPLLRVRTGVGTEADRYALTSQNSVIADRGRIDRVRIEPVHDAWVIVGHHLRRIYELITCYEMTCKVEIFEAARVPRATGDSMVLDLQVAGLIESTGRGTVGPGPTSLGQIADRELTSIYRQARIERFQRERAAWREWLEARDRQHREIPDTDAAIEDIDIRIRNLTHDSEDEVTYRESVMTTGPPELDDLQLVREAIELVADTLGGRIIAA